MAESGYITHCFIFKRVLSAEEILALYENPFVMFQPYEPSRFKRMWRRMVGIMRKSLNYSKP